MNKQKPPTSKELSEVLKSKGIKDHILWHKKTTQWNEIDFQMWEKIKDGEVTSAKVSRIRNRCQVVRISDGFIYPTQLECIKSEGISQRKLFDELDREIKFKRLGGYKPSPWIYKKVPKKTFQRMSDGKIYDSVKECAIDNNIPLRTMRTWIDNGKGFKKIK